MSVFALPRWLAFPEHEPIPPSVLAAQTDASAAESLLRELQRHSLSPLLHVRAKQQHLSFVPVLADELARAYHLSLARHGYFGECLRELLEVCAPLGADVVALKGIYLASALYPARAARPLVDLDVLLRRADVPPVIAALRTRGYDVFSSEPRGGNIWKFENGLLVARSGARGHSPIGLHWNLLDDPFYQRHLNVEAFWSRAQPVSIGGLACLSLGTEELLVYLCAHFALHHQWTAWLWACDIALLLAQRGEGLEWQRVLRLARDNALVLCVRETLARVNELFGSALPSDVWSQLQSLPVTDAEARVLRAHQNISRSPGRAYWSDLRGVGNWGARLSYALAHALPSPEYMQRRYTLAHRSQLPAAYVRRWWRGLRSLRLG
ncbi:MAG: nucleotidyltransferase family protein [Chloroflexi bacterium]|nr:nucleotidyltransferase family protein [Chloroflexota bacterium]